jgi:hypothetical protein
MTDRSNTDLAAAVDQALTMADKRAAAAFLTARGASFALTCRVLAERARRREVAARVLALPIERRPIAEALFV